MQILFVTLGFYPALAWGGPVKVVYQNGKELVRRGHSVTVYCTNLLNKKQKIQPGTFERIVDRMRIVYFDTLHLSWWPGTLGPIWLPDLPAFLRREIKSFDVVHLNGYRNPMMLPIVQAARHAGVPFITQPQGTLPIVISSFLLKHIYDRLFGSIELKGIATLIALQERERQQALAHGIPAERIEIIPNGIEAYAREKLPEPGSFRRRYSLASDRPLILFLGRINKIKGTDMLVQAFAKLKIQDAQLAIVGPDDGQLHEVENMIQQLCLSDRVVVTGLIPDIDKMAAFQDADLFVLPSRSDAYPTTVMEACMVGIPMVITDRCEMAHLVTDRVADIVPFDPQAFATAIERLLTDHDRYARYQANCQNVFADTFSIGTVVDHLEAVYQRVITEKVNEQFAIQAQEITHQPSLNKKGN